MTITTVTGLEVGDTRRPNLSIDPADADTVAVLTVTSPLAVITPVNVTRVGDVWTADAAYTLTSAGDWFERWVATNAVTGIGAGAAEVKVSVEALQPATGTGAGAAYATPTDYANIIGAPMPANLPRLLRVASGQIRDETFAAVFDTTDATVIAALKEATCEQVAWGQANGWTGGYPVAQRAVSIGKVSIGGTSSASSGGSAAIPLLAPAARRILREAGLQSYAIATDLGW